MNRTIHEVVEIVQTCAKEKGIKLVWQPDLRLPRLIYDDEGLHRAILNVLSNAVDAVEERVLQDQEKINEGIPVENPLPPCVTISVGLSLDAKFAEIVIEDTGAGIEPTRLNDIFNLFVSSKGARGTGLGLPVSQKILREHGGEIVVTSEPGRGSRFLLRVSGASEEQHQTRSVPIVPTDMSQPSEAQMGVDAK